MHIRNLAAPGSCPAGFEDLADNEYCVANPRASATTLSVVGLAVPSRWSVAVAAINAENADATTAADMVTRVLWLHVEVSVLTSSGGAAPTATQLDGTVTGAGSVGLSWPAPAVGGEPVYGFHLGYRSYSVSANMTGCIDGYDLVQTDPPSMMNCTLCWFEGASHRS